MTIRPWLRDIVQRWCLPCIAVGIAVFLMPLLAAAQSATPESLFTAKDIIVALFGLLMSLVSTAGAAILWAFRNQLTAQNERMDDQDERIEKHDASLQKIEKDILRDYHTKADINLRFERMEEHLSNGFTSVHRRLDQLHAPHASSKD